MKQRFFSLVVLFLLIAAGGGLCPLADDAPFGRPCEDDVVCGDGYRCGPDNTCVSASVLATQDGGLLGPKDGGAQEDSGIQSDSGPQGDGGALTPDAGLDAGAVDAGRIDGGGLDAGLDGGLDAGPPACTPDGGQCDNGIACDGVELCVDGDCAPGVPPCAGGYCIEPGTCVACLEDEHCQDESFCNGPEVCAQNQCVPGNPACGNGSTCLEQTQQCVGCVAAADCDNGNFCDGLETCGVNNECVPGGDPCSPALPHCREFDDTCVQCVVDEHCPEETPACLNGTCVPCTQGFHCADDAFCNGTESCQNNQCVSTGDPCAGSLSPYCNEESDICQECTSGSQCGDPEPYCKSGKCTECIYDDGARPVFVIDTNTECSASQPICLAGVGCVECTKTADCAVNETCLLATHTCILISDPRR